MCAIYKRVLERERERVRRRKREKERRREFLKGIRSGSERMRKKP